MSKVRTEPENLQLIHQRYEDTALVIFRQDQKRSREPTSLLQYGDSCQKHYSYTRNGNAAVIVRKSGRNVNKVDERPIQSVFCTIM